MANKTFDSLGLIIEGEAVTTTASCAGANIDGLALGNANYVVVVNTNTLVGTFDGSNNYTFQVQVSDTLGGTYVAIGEVVTVTASGQFQIGFTSEQLERLTSGADYFRVTATKVGTTATGITYTAFASRV